MSELSASDYRKILRSVVDKGTVNPDLIFKQLVAAYFAADPEDDLVWDAQDDMEEVFSALGSVFGTIVPANDDWPRIHGVTAWVTNIGSQQPPRRAKPPTNVAMKFQGRMDLFQHFCAGADLQSLVGWKTLSAAINLGKESYVDTLTWLGSMALAKQYVNGGFDYNDLIWTEYGIFLAKSFQTSEAKARALAKKFLDGTFTIGSPAGWYGKPETVLYGS